MCLYCATPAHDETAVNATPRALPGAGVESRHGSTEVPRATSNIRPDTSSAPVADDGDGAVQADAARGWQPWNDSSPRTFSASGAGPLWFGLGELRGLMAVSHYVEPAGGIATAIPQTAHEQQSAPEEDQTTGGPGVTPPPGPTSAPEPPALPPSATGPSAPPSNAAPTNPFVAHTAPPADPFVPPAPKGLLDPAGPGGTGTGSSDPAATQEPASVLLIGAGLVALLTDLRRRRRI
jgi:hypothetical protein